MATWNVTIDDLVLGAGSGYELVNGPEALGLPEVRTSDQPRPQDHGLFWGSDYLGGRSLVLEMVILGATPADAAARMDALSARWQPPRGPAATKTLTVELPGVGPRILNGRPRRLAFGTAQLKAGVVTATAEFAAADPRLYEAIARTGTAGLPIVSGGRTYNRIYPLTYGALGLTGAVLAMNVGNYPTRPLAIITGPVTNPRLQNVTTGETLAFTYVLGAGSILVVDFDGRTVLEGGTSSRYYALTPGSTWWELQPGLNEISFRADAYQAAAQVELRWRSAWL